MKTECYCFHDDPSWCDESCRRHTYVSNSTGVRCVKCGDQLRRQEPALAFSSPWRWQNRMTSYFFKLGLLILLILIIRHALHS